jgi:uncharacterized membrane protein YphA (DoxX/SURF4 family)
MLNPFPIQFLALFAYTILRACVGAILIYLGLAHIKHREELREKFSFPLLPFGRAFAWYLGIVELVVGAMFFMGFYTQIAALLSCLLSLKFIVMNKRFASPSVPGRLFYVLLLAASFSLFITGAGFFAFDLPI